MSNQKDAAAELQALVSKLEVDAAGIARLEEWKGTKLEETALRLLPAAQSVVVLAMEVFREILDHARVGRKMGGAPMKDLLESHIEFLAGRLNEATYDVAQASRRLGLKALPLPCHGIPFNPRLVTSIFSYKHAAQAAGLGNIGRHSLLITREFGPRIRLACCLTEAVLTPTPLKSTYNCAECHVCIDRCPARALAWPQGDELYRINKFACYAFSAGSHCSECMRLCPARS